MAVISRTRANTYYRAAMEASPQYVAAAALRAKIVAAQHSLPGVPAVAAPVDTDGDISVWLDSVVEAAAAEHAREVKVNALRERLIWCDKTITDVAVTETNNILAHLDDALTDVMDRVAGVVDNLNGARNAQQVIDAEVGDTWKQLRPLRDEYDKLRTAQQWAMAGEDALTWSRSDYLWDDQVASDLILANLDELYPQWKTKTATTFKLSDAPEPDPRPWPTNPIEQLVWLSASDAVPWVPTLQDLAALNHQRLQRINQPNDQDHDGNHLIGAS
jgi:hypothetical protein